MLNFQTQYYFSDQLSEDKEPLTIVFNTQDSSDIDSAFLKNKRRIPLKLKIDDLTLGQKKDWKFYLDPFSAKQNLAIFHTLSVFITIG